MVPLRLRQPSLEKAVTQHHQERLQRHPVMKLRQLRILYPLIQGGQAHLVPTARRQRQQKHRMDPMLCQPGNLLCCAVRQSISQPVMRVLLSPLASGCPHLLQYPEHSISCSMISTSGPSRRNSSTVTMRLCKPTLRPNLLLGVMRSRAASMLHTGTLQQQGQIQWFLQETSPRERVQSAPRPY